MIYLADNWPAQYRDQIFMNNIHGNRVNNDLLVRNGSGYVGNHAPDVMLANDKWFRGINLKYGPDGSVYVIDWYDPNACHRTNPEIWDRTNGRIYNLSYGDVQRRVVDLALLNDLQLVELQSHPNEWYVRMARRLLQERAAAGTLDSGAVHDQLWRIAREHAEVPRRLRHLGATRNGRIGCRAAGCLIKRRRRVDSWLGHSTGTRRPTSERRRPGAPGQHGGARRFAARATLSRVGHAAVAGGCAGISPRGSCRTSRMPKTTTCH